MRVPTKTISRSDCVFRGMPISVPIDVGRCSELKPICSHPLFNSSRSRLKQYLQSKLNHARPRPRVGYLAEGGAGRRRVGRQELSVVQSVDGLCAELEPDPLPEIGILDQREIPVVGAVSPDPRKTAGQ